MRHKTFELIEIKAEGEPGSFSALASVFGNVDLVGDRMVQGAFSKTLARWRKSGDPIPVVLSHDWDDPMKYVGKADPRAVIETEDGLLVQGTLDVGNGNPVADQVYKLMKQRLLKGWSFGYTVPEGGEKIGKDGANNVSEVDLVEVGPTLKGANPEAQLQSIKSASEVEALGLSEEEAQLIRDHRAQPPEPDHNKASADKPAKEAPDKDAPEPAPKASPLRAEVNRAQLDAALERTTPARRDA